MDSGSESDAPKALVLPELKKGKVDRHDRLFDRLLAPVRQTAECISEDFKFRGVGAPPRVARPERSEQLPVIPSEPRKASQWQAKTARPRLASRRLMKAGEVPKPRQRAGSTAAEAAFITEVLGADRVVVRGDDIAAELVGRNEELVEFAKHRLDSRIQATQTSRKKAVQWRQQQRSKERRFSARDAEPPSSCTDLIMQVHAKSQVASRPKATGTRH
ncbi:unnamed protein product [Effrenium voratum]|nr:unnamed protein product [Effrenium voratum]